MGGLGKVNNGQVAEASREEYNADPIRFRHGKTVLGHLLSLLQVELKENPTVLVPTPVIAAVPEGSIMAHAMD